MTQEEKQLLLKDLCARLPYGVKVHIDNDGFYDKREPYDIILTIQSSHLLKDLDRETGPDAIIIRPYLRPMSSMTKDEEQEFSKDVNSKAHYMPIGAAVIDWLLKNNFDFHGLIPMGLALEATKDIYKTK